MRDESSMIAELWVSPVKLPPPKLLDLDHKTRTKVNTIMEVFRPKTEPLEWVAKLPQLSGQDLWCGAFLSPPCEESTRNAYEEGRKGKGQESSFLLSWVDSLANRLSNK